MHICIRFFLVYTPMYCSSVMFGLMWVSHKNREFVIRHNCDQNDPTIVYGWKRHDGEEFGEQNIIDNGVCVCV